MDCIEEEEETKARVVHPRHRTAPEGGSCRLTLSSEVYVAWQQNIIKRPFRPVTKFHPGTKQLSHWFTAVSGTSRTTSGLSYKAGRPPPHSVQPPPTSHPSASLSGEISRRWCHRILFSGAQRTLCVTPDGGECTAPPDQRAPWSF